MSVTISKASGADLPEILALLAAVELPPEGVAGHLEGFLVARDGARLVGCAGLERHRRLGLLRSVAVSPGSQHSGIGSRLAAALLEDAEETGIEEVVLLTTTARDFFARWLGFTEAQRAAYDERLEASLEWRLPRCASAVCMAYRIRKPDNR
jgi:N-acetylglutamate synthase-like GNAT family acetyltransferase